MTSTFIDDSLLYKAKAVNKEVNKSFVKWLERQEFQGVTSSANSRKVLQFGEEYRYTGTSKDSSSRKDFPPEVVKLRELLSLYLSFSTKSNDIDEERNTKRCHRYFNQCIINRYEPGQGISAHVDDTKLFRGVVACFTFGSGAETEFSRVKSITREENVFSLYTEPRSLYIMSGESRYDWKHCMKARKSDPEHGTRGVRYSVTFRSHK